MGRGTPIATDGGSESHHHHEHDRSQLGVALATISSTRSMDDDPAGDFIESAIEDDGHELVVRELLRDDHDSIQQAIYRFTKRKDVDAVITTGGTGVSPDDVTVEAVKPLLEKELDGFGELFRSLSYEEIGSLIVATRAIGGVADGKIIYCLPGSKEAARLGVESIILDVTPHLVGLAQESG